MTNVQATEPDFELRSLGWKAFQDLCATVTSEVLGQTVQVFLPSNDGGRDGAFRGNWKPREGEELHGSFVVQCKFSRDESTLSLAALDDELEKAKRLAKRGDAVNYILMTNHKVSGRAEEEIRKAFLAINGIESFQLLGRDWITLRIRESARLRMVVPRVYGLGDLSQILDERAYGQAIEILSSLGQDLAKFVVTEPHARAAHALVKHGFVLLLGEPAAGKSTIAASLAVGALDLWGCSTLKVRNADEFIEHWNPNEPRQFFWVDDAFGTTQYQRELAHEWNQAFPHVTTAVRKGARILFTSRDYIYRAARSDLKIGAFPLVNESQVVIDVQQLSIEEKEQIIYNHIKLGTQPAEFRGAIKYYLPTVAKSSRFLPEIARRLGDPLFTQGLRIDSPSIRRFVDEPLKFLIEVVTNLDRASRTALALIFIRGGILESPIELTSGETRALEFFGASLQEAKDALGALNGSLVILLQSGGKRVWTFKHPTISDAYASLIADDPEFLDFYLAWTRIEKLMGEVTCGEVGLEGVRVVVPENRYDAFVRRLPESKKKRELLTFLATRCSRDFLAVYLQRNPDFGLSLTDVNSYLSLSADVDVLCRLQQVGLLKEEWRLRFVQNAQALAIDTPDADMFSVDEIRRLFTADEMTSLRQRVHDELLPTLRSTVYAHQEEIDEEIDPNEWFAELSEVIDTLENEFKGDAEALRTLQIAGQAISIAIDEIMEGRWSPDEPDYEEVRRSSSQSTVRSIFDDVDG